MEVYKGGKPMNHPEINIDENTTIGELLSLGRGPAQILYEFGMHCLTCPSAQHESVAQAALTHGVNLDELLHQLWEWEAEQDNEW